ncbi:putative surface antigen [Candidatus Termititenax persephonae]|uniref:Surface antigen n=1 Tax=Candidatus Termititenax persephonae TaxID=2218525 RepID=A0A388TIV8_9BACT|nr:putative surface antigen [Candidatus Termititenax persephonae]
MDWGASRYLTVRYERLRDTTQGTEDILPIRREGFSSDLGLPLPFGRRYRLTFEYKDEFVQEDPPRANPAVAYLNRSLAAVYTYDGLHYRGDTSIVTNGDFLRLRFENGGALNALNTTIFDLGGVDFRRNELRYSRFLALSNDNHVIGLNYHGGAYVSPRERNILEGEEYSVGGGTTVRGYADVEPFAVGPKLLVLNAEYRYIFNDYWQGVLFYDWGNAYTEPRVSVKDFQSGYGAGARISTPVGALRLDLARGSQWWIFHFGIGATF